MSSYRESRRLRGNNNPCTRDGTRTSPAATEAASSLTTRIVAACSVPSPTSSTLETRQSPQLARRSSSREVWRRPEGAALLWSVFVGFVRIKFKDIQVDFKNFRIQGLFERGQMNLLKCKLNVLINIFASAVTNVGTVVPRYLFRFIKKKSLICRVPDVCMRVKTGKSFEV